MKKTLNIIPSDPELVFIALNPTEEAIANKAVFSRDNAFWNVLKDAEIIEEGILEVPLIDRAKAVFQDGKHTKMRVGFADLLPLIIETDSKKVKVPRNAARDMLEKSKYLKDAKRLALLGQDVVDSFAKDFNNLKKWREIPLKNGERQFGLIGTIELAGNEIEVFAMPFPVNNSSVKDKHRFYQILTKP